MPLLPTVFGPRPPELAADARADLAACRAALRNGSKTFLAASWLLPRSVHEPASALYAFCRLADDAVDGQAGGMAVADGAEDVRGADVGAGGSAVDRLRERVALAYAGRPQPHPADRALACVVARHGIPAALFDALLEGFEWDLQGRRYETLDDVCGYAARVAGTVGAMMALLMGVRSAPALARACDLGVAMQLSNISRDVGEDARRGRLYLPRRWMAEAGLDPEAWLASPTFSPALAQVVQRLLAAADVLYRRVDAGVADLPMACRPGINAARFLYAGIGHAVARNHCDCVSSRARVPAPRKALLLLRALMLLTPSRSAQLAPPLPATAFLVDACRTGETPAAGTLPASRRWTDRLVWTCELFARLESREKQLRQRGAARLPVA